MIKVFRKAFVLTVPVMLGYLVLGVAFGMLLESIGFGVLWALGISLSVYAGSMQFVLIGFLSGGIGLLEAAAITLSVNSRHIFYGISFLEKFKGMGKRFWYMVFSLTDETYSLLCAIGEHKGINQKNLMFAIAVMDHLYWVAGCVLGNLLGSIFTFNTAGLEFSMTALFAVIFIEQWISYSSHIPALIGIFSAALSLTVLGSEAFLLPALMLTVALLIALKSIIKNRMGGETE